jgi:RNA polymerase sigma-70 factor (sigma-E family)
MGTVTSTNPDRPAVADRSRIAELYVRHADGAVRLAYLLVGDRALAEDVVQDAFVRVFGRLAHLRDPGAFEPYLRRTVVNLCRSTLRRWKVERAYLRREERTLGREPVARPGSSIEERDEIWHAMRSLTPRQRAAIVLRFYEDLPEREVAEILRCRPGTVKSLVSRGLETLRHEMRGVEHERPA